MATARRFAAALGIISFVFVAGFGLWRGSEVDWVLLRALLALIVFSVFGFLVGLVGAAIANDSADTELREKIEAEKATRQRRQEERAARERGAAESRSARQTAGAAPGGAADNR